MGGDDADFGEVAALIGRGQLHLECFAGPHRHSERFAQKFARRAAQHRFGGRVGKTDRADGVHDDHTVGAFIDDVVEGRLAHLEGATETFADVDAVHVPMSGERLVGGGLKCFVGLSGRVKLRPLEVESQIA